MKLFWVVWLLLLPRFSHAAPAPLLLLTMEYPPFSFEEQGQVKGISVEVIREAFQRIGQPVTIEISPWARALRRVEAGDVDALFPAAEQAKRKRYADYSVPLFRETVSLFVTDESTFSFNGELSSLEQQVVGVVRGFTYGKQVDQAINAAPPQHIYKVTSVNQALKMLAKHRIDALINGRLATLYSARRTGLSTELKELPPALDHLAAHLIFSKKRQLDSVIQAFNAEITAMRESGRIRQITEQFLQATNVVAPAKTN